MSKQTQPGTAQQALAEKLRTDAIAIFGEGQAERDIIEWFYGAMLAAAPATPAAQGAVPDVSAMARVLSDRVASACCVDPDDNWKIYGQEYIEDVRAMLAAAPAPVVPEVPALWAKSLGFCWAADADYPEEDWIVGTVDEDGNRYDVLRVEASQYDAAGESQKIAEAIVALWAWAAHPAERQEQGEVQRLREALQKAAGHLNNARFLIAREMPGHSWLSGIDKGIKGIDAALAASTGQEVEK